MRLDLFSTGDYTPGRSSIVRAAWHFFGQPILESRILVSYKVKARLLKTFGARIGTGLVIKPGVRVKYPWRLSIGDHVWLGEDAWIDNLADVTIGDHACISQGAYLCTGNHDWSSPSFDYRLAPVVIGSGAWIGAKSFLAPGVHVGEHAILTAASAAYRSIDAFEIHSGNPAKKVKIRTYRQPRQIPETTRAAAR